MALRIDQFYLYRTNALKFLGWDDGKPLFRAYGRASFGDEWKDAGFFTLPEVLFGKLKSIPPPA